MVVVCVLISAVALAVFGALHRYVWRRLVRRTTSPGSLPRRASIVFVAGPLLSVGAMTGRDELQELNAAIARFTVQGERLPAPVLAMTGVEAPTR